MKLVYRVTVKTTRRNDEESVAAMTHKLERELGHMYGDAVKVKLQRVKHDG